ncbi:MAG: tetratricopeptide repeat protein, partial [Gammaproteobacteria bacterium]
RYGEADPLFARTLTIQENFLGPENPDIVPTLEGYASLLRATDRADEAERLELRAAAIRAKQAE